MSQFFLSLVSLGSQYPVVLDMRWSEFLLKTKATLTPKLSPPDPYLNVLICNSLHIFYMWPVMGKWYTGGEVSLCISGDLKALCNGREHTNNLNAQR